MAFPESEETIPQSSLPESIQPYLDEIAKRLWEGHASVLVGAGFSRNAVPVSGSGHMPSWTEIAEALHKRLYPEEQGNPQGKDALALADEYSAVFGDSDMDRLVKEVIDDDAFTPSTLHSRLTELPWSEVLTTNYDTLLERAAETVISRRYDIVTRIDDLPFSSRPRIVKLHGSFPKCTPFIISGEQYRRYPIDSAPFVNTVQQALMENLLCLVGFSGEDPNFERWIGWVRDNLQDSMPYVYMIGLLNMSESKRRALTEKKIIPIDLSLVDGISNHQQAMSFFLRYLENNKAMSPEEWQPQTGIAPALATKIPSEDILSLIGRWKSQRQTYPGWVVLPRKFGLWFKTQDWIPHIIRSNVSPPNDLLAAYELDWRLKKSLVHPIPEVMEWTEKIVKRYNPFPQQLPDFNAEMTPANTSESNLPWPTMQIAWVELVFALAKGYRLKLAKPPFDYWMGPVLTEDIRAQSPEWIARWHYEKCMYHIIDLDIEALRAAIAEWPRIPELPFHEVRRSGLLVDLGEYELADEIIREALVELRRRTNLKPVTGNLTELSGESVAMLLAKLIRDSGYVRQESPKEMQEWSPESERQKILCQYDCEPHDVLTSIVQNLKSVTINHGQDVQHTVTFDGQLRCTKTLLCGFPDDFRHAVEFANFFEEAGVPTKCPYRSLADRKTVQRAAEILAPEDSAWAMALLIRSGSDKALELLFSRATVARMEQEAVDAYLSQYAHILIANIRQLPSPIKVRDDTLLTRQCKILSEIVSRLAIRCPVFLEEELLDIAVQMWNASDDTVFNVFGDSIHHMFHRLLTSVDLDSILRFLPTLLSLPIAEQPSVPVKLYKKEPMESISWPSKWRLPQSFDHSSWTQPINTLIGFVESGTEHQRESAIIRLTQLYEIAALEPQEIQRFGNALWHSPRLDPATGLPLNTSLCDRALLWLPHPQGIDPEVLIKAKVLTGEFPLQTGKSFALTQGSIPFVGTLVSLTAGLLDTNQSDMRFINWTEPELLQLLDKIITWWDSDKAHLSKADHPFVSERDEFHARFSNIPTLLSHVLFPRLSADIPEPTKENIRRLLLELSNHDIPCLRSRVAAMTMLPDSNTDITQEVSIALSSSQVDSANDACVAFTTWRILASQDKIPQPPREIIDAVSDIIYLRHLPALRYALHELQTLINHDLLDDVSSKILVGLEHLKTDTSLDNENTNIDLESRPEYRRLAAALSYALYSYCQRHNLEIPSVTDQWQQIAKNDPLPEVRNAWAENSAHKE